MDAPLERTAATADQADEPRRKRKRRRRGGKPEAPVVKAVGQDKIIIDIDEDELEIVRDAFGEIDELDDLTVKGRRRGVMDSLQEEVELEDLSGEDETPSSARSEDDSDDDNESSTDDDSQDASAQDGDKKKRRRRKRKKKEVFVEPELMVPPHKDFWEAWATRFHHRDFEDEVLGPPPGLTEPPPAPPSSKPRTAHVAEVEMAAVDPDEPLVHVVLNVGRKHGKKSADIRELLKRSVGLGGRAIRDLTVLEQTSEFRMVASGLTEAQERLSSQTIDGVTLALMVTTDLPDSAIAEPTDDAPALPEPSA